MILAAFHLAARRDRSTHQKQEPSDGYVSISCDVAKCRQSATGPIAAVLLRAQFRSFELHVRRQISRRTKKYLGKRGSTILGISRFL